LLLGLAIFGAFGLMHQLSSLAMGNVARSSIVRAIVFLLLVVFLMCGVSRLIRPARGNKAASVRHEFNNGMPRISAAFSPAICQLSTCEE
jgi:fumarate reductase subunit D